MKAMVHHEYGPPDVLALEDVAAPAVGDDRVLVRVHAAAVNPLDWHLLTGKPVLVRLRLGLRAPKSTIRGVDVAGTVEAVGKAVTQFEVGDEVFGEAGQAFAEYVSASEDALVRKPANVTFEQAAAVPVAALTALQGLRDKGEIQAGRKVLVNGASGGVGTFAVQIAKALGAEVTGVCSTRNVEMVRTVGADRVVDYTEEDFTRDGSRYDLLLDAVGNRALSDCRRALAPGGIYVAVGAPKKMLPLLVRMAAMVVRSWFGDKKMRSMLTRTTKADLVALRDLLETGAVTPVIDRTYPLGELPEALQYQGEFHGRGKTVITVA